MSRAQSGGDGGVSVTTLVIASCSAAVATVAVPLFWEKGTLIAAALTRGARRAAGGVVGRPPRVLRASAAAA